jgi:hypothetical protein
MSPANFHALARTFFSFCAFSRSQESIIDANLFVVDQFSLSRPLPALLHHRGEALLLAQVVLHRLIEQVAAVAVHGLGDQVQLRRPCRGDAEADGARGVHNTR